MELVEGTRFSLRCRLRIRRVSCWPFKVGHMFEMVQLLAETNLSLLIFSVLIFDIPRYTLSLLSLSLFAAWRRSDTRSAGNASVTAIIPTFNGGPAPAPPPAPLSRHARRPSSISAPAQSPTQ